MSSNNIELLAVALDKAEAELRFLEDWQAKGKTFADYIELSKLNVTFFKLRIDKESNDGNV